MRFLSSPTRFYRVGRIPAILAMVVLLAGKTVHIHQECDGCCSTATDQQASATSTKTCPFGCTHHADRSSDPTSGCPKPDHDESNCTVCQLLAQSPSCPVLLSLPDQSDIVVEVIPLRSEAAVTGTISSAQPRGPPHAA